MGARARIVALRIVAPRSVALWLVAVPCIALPPRAAHAQLTIEPRDTRFWAAAAAAVSVGVVFDERLRAGAARHQTEAMDRLSRVVDPFGRARYLVPSLVVSVAAPRLAGGRAFSDAALWVALSYAAADGIESVLKPAVGRHRPDSTGQAWRLRPFSARDPWHSFPSAHTVHSFAIAAAASREADRPWVAAASYTVATLVGLERLYGQAHWASDVAASAALAIVVSRSADSWLERRGLGRLLRPRRR